MLTNFRVYFYVQHDNHRGITTDEEYFQHNYNSSYSKLEVVSYRPMFYN